MMTITSNSIWKLTILLFVTLTHITKAFKTGFSGCTVGITSGFQNSRHPRIAACDGIWDGHIENASRLCSQGWRVCGWEDTLLLKSITWKDATSLPGCYAINAAQDGGQCKPCVSNLQSDDLGGVGSSCPHQNEGKESCINGGQIDASCCSDTRNNRACYYKPGIVSGVLCCKLRGIPPQILVAPNSLTHVTTGVTFVLSCQALGTPTPSVKWLKNGKPIPKNISRIADSSGYLLISEAAVSDTGKYVCEVSNIVGSDKAVAQVIVTEHESGCSDGTTDGLYDYEDMQACAGSWQGHVKRGRSLCARGWHVCNPRHRSLLKMITWAEATSLPGCYAYNGANILNQCTRCHRQNMAGIGSRCGRTRRTHKSCLAEGRIDVYKNRAFGGCHYQKGLTTGVLCCRRSKRLQGPLWRKPSECSPKCANGGRCIGKNMCRCQPGYKGAWCQNAICPGGCIPNSTCVKPSVCRCRPGHNGKKCRRKECRAPCLHGGRCKNGKCKCTHAFAGPYCQYVHQKAPTEHNRTEK